MCFEGRNMNFFFKEEIKINVINLSDNTKKHSIKVKENDLKT